MFEKVTIILEERRVIFNAGINTYVMLDRIYGISGKRYARLHHAKIYTLDDLQALDATTLTELLQLESVEEAEKLMDNIQLFAQRSIRILEEFTLPPLEDVVFFDLEATASSKQIFLATFAAENEYATFIKDNSSNFMKDIGNYLANLPQTILVSSSGSNWDYSALLSQIGRYYKTNNPVQKFKGLDLMKFLTHRLQSPVGFSVKKFSEYLGHKPLYDPLQDKRMNRLAKKYKYISLKKKTGYLIGKAYESGAYTSTEKQAFIDYNIEDVRALKAIYEILTEHATAKTAGTIISLV